jgi:serine phosphatase RsbU (regulator of sigma subunit)/anti-sigma regulatory factor (Ser/Thr protein kinase)
VSIQQQRKIRADRDRSRSDTEETTMTSLAQTVRRVIRRREPAAPAFAEGARVQARGNEPAVEIAENDPILAYLQTAPGPVDLETLQLDSPAVRALRAAGVQLVVPLVSQGELIGTLNLGPRLSEQEYSADDRRLLDSLAGQAAPALRVAQLVREQEAEARERQRIEQELQVAQLIQQHFLPTTLPQPAGWSIEAYYRPARAVGGDFYDVIERADGKIAFTVGDVTDKGVPAAMVMAATRSLLRAAGVDQDAPGAVLAQVNELLHGDIPSRMFVTCLYGILDPTSGEVRFANAGHNLPFVRRGDEAVELDARGMPLGLMAGMTYAETEARLAPGEQILLHSDGIAEAHDPAREMFGIPRLARVVGEEQERRGGLIANVLAELERFTGAGWEQEDDITLVALSWSGAPADELLAEFSLPSEPGNEREAMRRVAETAAAFGIAGERLEQLKTAVAEATMNAIEHGNRNDPVLPVTLRLLSNADDLKVQISDEGGERPIPISEAPDIEAKLRGEQKPRGWGLFLIQNMVDAMRVTTHDGRHTVELVMRRKEDAR